MGLLKKAAFLGSPVPMRPSTRKERAERRKRAETTSDALRSLFRKEPTEPPAPAHAAPPPQGPPAGWYNDPQGAPVLRWWDGTAWTAHTHTVQPNP